MNGSVGLKVGSMVGYVVGARDGNDSDGLSVGEAVWQCLDLRNNRDIDKVCKTTFL